MKVLMFRAMSNGISRTQNPEVFKYLKKLNDRGEISAVIMRIVMDAFWGIELPVVSKNLVVERSRHEYSTHSIYSRVGATKNMKLLESVISLNARIEANNLLDQESEIKMVHAGIVRFFL